MVRKERPGIDPPGARFCEGCDPRKEVVPIRVVLEDDTAFQVSHHHVVEGLRGIQARLRGHGRPHPSEIIQDRATSRSSQTDLPPESAEESCPLGIHAPPVIASTRLRP